MPHWDFPATEPIDVLVEVTAGRVRITAEHTETVTVDIRSAKSGQGDDGLADEVRVDFADGRLEIVEKKRPGWMRFSSGLDVVVSLPTGSRCWLSTASADFSVSGELASLAAKTISGRVAADTVTGDAEVSTTSGRIRIDDAAGQVSVKSASGAVDVGHAASDVDINTVSGRVKLGRAEANANIRTASGRIRVHSLSRGHAEIVSVSGGTDVGVARGAGVYLDMASLSGRVTSELEPSEPSDEVDLHLNCRSVSGSIRVARADLADVI